MSDLLKPSRLERAVLIVLISNVPVWLLGALGIALSLEYGHWGSDSFAALLLFIYLPVAMIGAAVAALTALPQQARKRLLWVLVLWGLITIAFAAVLTLSMVI